jgi:ABC-type sugar transport system ATPase subunit
MLFQSVMIEPGVLWTLALSRFDKPLSNLDAQLRSNMRPDRGHE